jgi:hypothetical protein
MLVRCNSSTEKSPDERWAFGASCFAYTDQNQGMPLCFRLFCGHGVFWDPSMLALLCSNHGLWTFMLGLRWRRFDIVCSHEVPLTGLEKTRSFLFQSHNHVKLAGSPMKTLLIVHTSHGRYYFWRGLVQLRKNGVQWFSVFLKIRLKKNWIAVSVDRTRDLQIFSLPTELSPLERFLPNYLLFICNSNHSKSSQ